jgi:hypothetical protein
MNELKLGVVVTAGRFRIAQLARVTQSASVNRNICLQILQGQAEVKLMDCHASNTFMHTHAYIQEMLKYSTNRYLNA